VNRRRLAAVAVALGVLSAAAPAAVRAQVAEENAPAVVTAATAPPEARVVTAEGRAAIDPAKGGAAGARQAALALALRNAVEKAAGVYVSGRTLTQNYQTLRDQVLTRADGYATLKEVVKEEVGADTVRVVVRAEVTLKPLAEQLKALGLTRAFRVLVRADAGKGSDRAAYAAARDSAVSALQNGLTDAGFVVTENPKDADVTVTLAPRFSVTHETPLDTATGKMVMRTVRGDYTVRAAWAGTGEVVAALSATDSAMHIDLATACGQTADDALATLAPRLADALMVLPARASQPVTLVVGGLPRAAAVAKLEDALETLPGVREVRRRAYAAGKATWELDVFTDAVPLLSRAIEEGKPLRPFGLTVTQEARGRVVATSRGAAVARR
jgi:hypothetical protein